jgi:23S rRNA pseudouridine2605 synthase
VSEPLRQTGLARALSKLGYCSRSAAVGLIRAARVTVNDTVCRNPEKPVHLRKDHLAVDGTLIQPRGKVYLMLNKPRGLVTSASDEKGRDTVYSCLGSDFPWLAPVGRLDKASEGLLLLTNDSAWAARVSAPETHLEKTYHVQVHSVADRDLVTKLENGISTRQGDFLRAKGAAVLRAGAKNSWLEIVLDEGKNRHIRRLLAEFEIEVLRLMRVAIGPLQLGTLAKGAYRPLSNLEKQAIDVAMRRCASSGDNPRKRRTGSRSQTG